MSNDEYAGSTRNNNCHRSTPDGANGLEGSDVSHSGNGGVCTENETSCIKICESAARKFLFFVQAGCRIIKEPFYLIGETIVNIFEHPIFRAVLYIVVVFCLIEFFIGIGYAMALHDYEIALGNIPIGGR